MNDAQKPLITLVIPTRERAQTLKATLETALDQANDNFQIVVSDNFSRDNTKEVVESFSDSRITYVNTGMRVSMVDNWEFALQHARGEYVIYIGDDDGIMPGAINHLQRLIESRPYPVYSWKFHEYTWPIDGRSAVIDSIALATGTSELDLKKLARFAVKCGGWRSHLLPGLYHSLVSRRILEEVKSKTGKVFHSMAPDIFMQFALPAFVDVALQIREGLTVNGRSAKSNSGSMVAKDGAQIWNEFVREYGEYKMHTTLFPEAPVVVNVIPDSILVAMDLFPECYKGTKFGYSAMWAYVHRCYKYESLWGLLRKRKRIRARHSFSIFVFLFYNVIHRVLDLRVALRKKTLKWRKIEQIEECEYSNVGDCVKVIANLQSRKAIAYSEGMSQNLLNG